VIQQSETTGKCLPTIGTENEGQGRRWELRKEVKKEETKKAASMEKQRYDRE
jgi:hypothetical protein